MKIKATLSALEKDYQYQRSLHLGGSDMGAVQNIGFGCRRRLWYQKRQAEPDFPRDHRPEFDRGKYLEPVIRQLAQEQSGRTISEPCTMKHPDYDWLAGNLDGIVLAAAEGGPGVFEAKSVNRFIYKRFQKEGIRDENILQIQGYLMITGYKWAMVAILCPDPWSFAMFDVERDEELISQLLEASIDFWGRVENGPIPDPLEDPKDRRCQTCEFRRTCRGDELAAVAEPKNGTTPELVSREDLTALIQEIQELGEIKDEASEMYEEKRGELKGAIGENYGIRCSGYRVLFPTSYPERWDTVALKAIANEAKDLLNSGPCFDYSELDIRYSKILTLLESLIKAKKAPKPERSLRIYATGD